MLKEVQSLKEIIFNDKCKEYFIYNGLVSILELIEVYMPKYCANED